MSTDLVLSMLMLAALALLAGAFLLWRRTGDIKRPVLMVILALIAFANILIWTFPTADGTSPLDRAEQIGSD